MEAPKDFKSLQEQIQSSLVATTKSVNQITAEDLTFHRSMNPEVGKELDEKSARILEVAKSLLKSAASISGLRVPALKDVEDVENNWRGVVDVVDSLLEKTDTCLDEYTGVLKRGPDEPTQKKHPSQLNKSFRNQNLLKPQLAFTNKPQNENDSAPWKPLLTSKPHALVPLEKSLTTVTDELQYSRYRHPYEAEITQLKYPDFIYQKADPIQYQPIQTTTATWVDTFEGVQEMLRELMEASVIAVDLEHHDARSYVGLVSLMQISTRDKDWIVDTLKPWRQDLQILNQVFADPKILKVFHGAYMDIVWLQRDLGLYVNGLFDTYHACRALGYPGGSLAYLLKRFVNFDADKKYQMADWRLRPLPEEMFFYARSDTHFLLYIYDNLRNELIEKSEKKNDNCIETVLEKSRETALLRYDKQIYDSESGKGPGGWYSLLVKTPQIKTNEQLSVFRAVHAWRDQIARKDDEGPNYVMSNRSLSDIAQRIPLDSKSLYGALHPVSQSVRSRMSELLEVIGHAKAAGASGPSVMDIINPGSLGALAKRIRQSNEKEAIIKPSAVDSQDSLRIETSRLFGQAFGSSIWDPPDPALKSLHEGLSLAVPTPPLSAENFASKMSQITLNGSISEVKSGASPAVKDKASDELDADKLYFPKEGEGSTFVLKKGIKRKSDAMDKADAESIKETRQAQLISHKREKKGVSRRTLRAQRKRKNLHTNDHDGKAEAEAMDVDDDPEDAGDDDADDDDEAEEHEPDFDYSKAQSVLHSKSKGGGVKKEKKDKKGKQQAPFDPYSKSANAAKGMRRQQGGNGGNGEKGSRSMTFKK